MGCTGVEWCGRVMWWWAAEWSRSVEGCCVGGRRVGCGVMKVCRHV